MALPVPPAPTTRTRTGFWPNRSLGSVCSMRISAPLSAHKLRERLRQCNERFEWKPLALPGQPGPQSLESALMARQTANIGVREGALVEAALPGWNCRHRSAVRASHRAGTDTPVVRKVPEGRDGKFR